MEFLIETAAFPGYLHGQSGSGKTHAAACIYAAWPEKLHKDPGGGKMFSYPHESPLFLDAKGIIRQLSMSEGRSAILKRILAASLVVLDDVGTRDLSAAGAESLLDILNVRGKAPMIITCNHHPTVLQSEIGDERLFSRILAGRKAAWIGFDEFDWRIGK